jgi:hypothetical protein
MAKSILNSDFSPEIRRARIDCLNIYEISEAELETFEKGSPGSIYLNFAIFIFGVISTLATAMFTTKVESNITQIVFIVLIVVGLIAGVFLIILWYRNYNSLSKLIETIRKRLPREEIPAIEGENEYTLVKQANDDSAIEEVLDLERNMYELNIRPAITTNYWRLGIKFSNSTNIPINRLNPNIPLIHLTKWFEHDWLGFTFYDENNKLWDFKDKVLINKYANELVTIRIQTSLNKTNITVLSENAELYYHELDKYKFGKISAWGDGHDYSINCIIRHKEKTKK